VSEKILRRIFGLRREEVITVWRKLHNKELHNLNSSPNNIHVIISKEDELGSTYSVYGGGVKCIQNFSQENEG